MKMETKYSKRSKAVARVTALPIDEDSTLKQPVIAWFSCGATSAVACKLALQKYENVKVIYIKTGSEHQDNERFLKDCEQWFQHKIEIYQSNVYSNVEDVILKKHYINGPNGAPCTFHLKKQVRYKIEKSIGNWKGQVWGFDFCQKEINRAIRFKQQNPNTKPLYPLIEKKLTKEDSLGVLKKVGIELPTMYKLGYHNNNCIGCVKGGIGYWNKIRKDFPDVFIRMSKIERHIGSTCLKDENGLLFLDTLDPDRGNKIDMIEPDCSLFCAIEFENIVDKQVKNVLNGMNIYETK